MFGTKGDLARSVGKVEGWTDVEMESVGPYPKGRVGCGVGKAFVRTDDSRASNLDVVFTDGASVSFCGTGSSPRVQEYLVGRFEEGFRQGG